ncbi:MAG: PilZ domain-containing protein [Vampirovibrionales bacterium]
MNNLSRPLLFIVAVSVVLALVMTGGIVLLALVQSPLITEVVQFLSPQGSLTPSGNWNYWLNQALVGVGGNKAWVHHTLLGVPWVWQLSLSAFLLIAMTLAIRAGNAGRPWLMSLLLISMSRHLLWRGTATLGFEDPASTVVGHALFVAELLSFITLSLGCFQVWNPTQRSKNAPLLNYNSGLPSVDIMVCTYNEPMSVLYRTLVGCKNVDYPNKQIYLLDDGKRLEIQQLAHFLGVHYIFRENNLHAKAGNLNNALKQTQGELVFILDADHVPSCHTLKRLVGYFQNHSKLAFVQTPQHFYNLDPFQRNLLAEEVVNNEQDFFFHVVQPGQDYWNATFFAGTGALFRRKALESVKGFATETLTEDTHTGLRLHAKGWDSIMHSETLVAGMAQDCFADMIKQRYRWAKGMTQILRYDHPWLVKGLSLAQRLCYGAGIWYFFTGLLRLVFILSPIAYLMFGISTIKADFLEILIFYIPSLTGLYWGYSAITNKRRHLFWSEVYESSLFLYTTLAAFDGWLRGKKGSFNVTPKGQNQNTLQFEWTLVWPQVCLLLLCCLSMVVAACRTLIDPIYLGGLFTNFFWALYNIVILLTAIYVAMERPQLRLTPRVERRIRCELRLLDGTIAIGYVHNLSESGLAAEFSEPLPVAGTMSLKLLDWNLETITVVAVQVVYSYVNPEESTHRLGLRIVNRSDAQHQALIRHMFGDHRVWQRVYDAQQSWNQSLLTLLNTPFRINQLQELKLLRRTPRFQVFLPCLVQFDDANTLINAFTHEISETGISIILPSELNYQLGTQFSVKVAWNGNQSSHFRVVVKRVRPFQAGQVKVGVNFLRLTKEERLELIEHLYGPREGLIRVAPAVQRRLPCILHTPEGQRLHGFTFELSEMGMRIILNRPYDVNEVTAVQLDVHWYDDERAKSYTMNLVPQYLSQDEAGIQLLYFAKLSIHELDDLSQHIHQSQ